MQITILLYSTQFRLTPILELTSGELLMPQGCYVIPFSLWYPCIPCCTPCGILESCIPYCICNVIVIVYEL